MKPVRKYRYADAWIGAFLGGFMGGTLAVTILFLGFDDAIASPLVLTGASVGSGALVCGSLAFLWGKRFTDALDAGIGLFWNFFSDHPD